MDGSQGTAFLESNIAAAEKPESASSEEPRDDHARDDHHGIFCNNMQSICSDISKDKKSFAQSAREAVLEILRDGVGHENKKKSNGYEFKDDDVSEFVDNIIEQTGT